MMRRHIPALLLCCLGLTAPACLFLEEDSDPNTSPISKKEAARRIFNGDTRDYCEEEGWYGDGVCDSFCPQRDSADCDGGQVTHCGGLLGAQCPSDQYCEYAIDAMCGAADQTGVCKPKPDACDLVYAPVCGCDGQTYSNACAAASAGVSVSAQGECDQPQPLCEEEACGPMPDLAQPLPCEDGTIPHVEISCRAGADGICGWEIESEQCPDEPQPCSDYECGMLPPIDPEYCPDGQTPRAGYECERRANGACGWTLNRYECPDDRFCGGFAGIPCADGEFCNYEGSDLHCGFADGGGVCEPMPQGCTREYDPVCGCDGQTYSNTCVAHAAGVSVASQGACGQPDVCSQPDACGPVPPIAPPQQCADGSVEHIEISCEPSANGTCGWDIRRSGCPMPGQFCGGIAGIQCPSDEYCKYELDAMCGYADAGGVCAPKPQACPEIWSPVCGCDGVTYGNDCEAAAAGVSVITIGACR